MKLNLNKLSSTANASTDSSVNKLNLDALKTSATTETETTTTTTKPKLNLVAVASAQTSTTPQPTNTPTVNDQTVRETESSLNAFSISFTEGVEYDLDEIIFSKRRDNANCPLIVQVRDDNENDEKIVKAITKLILHDYNITFDPNDTVTASNYYKKVVYKVPDFYTVFDTYFNRYYDIYYKQITGVQEGALSLDTVIETIQSTHDEIYANLLNKEETISLYTSLSGSKAQVEYDFGTMPTIDYDDRATGGNVLVENLELDIVDSNLVLKYDDEVVENCTVAISDMVEKVFNFSNQSMTLYEDIGSCSDFTTTDIVINNISNETDNLITCSEVTI